MINSNKSKINSKKNFGANSNKISKKNSKSNSNLSLNGKAKKVKSSSNNKDRSSNDVSLKEKNIKKKYTNHKNTTNSKSNSSSKINNKKNNLQKSSGNDNAVNQVLLSWYPGHMTKAMRMMKEDIKLIDLVIEICDARIPSSSRNPDIDKLAEGKARLILLNKSDLSDSKDNDLWKKYYENLGIGCLLIDSKKSIGFKDIKNAVNIACKDKIENNSKKGIINRPLRAMVCGIPNVGKSTFINSYAKKACTKTGNKPGITKGKQWIRLDKTLELLDTPGVLWPRFDNAMVGRNLAMIGSINDEIIHEDELAIDILKFMDEYYKGVIENKYQIDLADDYFRTLESMGIKRGCLGKGGECDIRKISKMLIDDFRSGKLGRITIEKVNMLPDGDTN